MWKKLLLAIVGMAMGALAGLIVALLGAGNLAILAGAAVGACVFVYAVPRLG
jgi:hypothetical protein